MNGDDIERASSSDHLVLGTVVQASGGVLIIDVDHLEEVPKTGQRVTVVAGWDGEDRHPNHRRTRNA